MPRPKSKQPAYGFHVSGQARVQVDGKEIYFGKYGTPESYARYAAFLAAYATNGFKVPEDTPTHQAETEITVRHITADYRGEVLPKYEHANGHHNRLSNLLDLLDERFGDLDAEQFGPRSLGELRQVFIKAGNCRKYVNLKVRDVIRVFRHAVSRELIGPERLVALQSLPSLKIGDAHDNDPRQPVPIQVVERTLPELSPTVAAMIRIQLATGMRPGELFRMTPADIDRSDTVWFYRPDKHKTAHHGKKKSVPILGDARDALTPYLFGDANTVCFVNSRGNAWTKDSYRFAISRAIQRVNKQAEKNDADQIEHWTAYRLRHTAGQAVRDALGVEAAQALLGHASLDITEVYAKASEAKAIEAAKVAPKLKTNC